ncbi:5-oxoprolinase subunit C family protein [Falsibacillus albus]|nr:biotin-dependent carboxyltransferase family protein [Falsibacillus albus]
MGILVLKPGLLTTIQDLGRIGYQNLGVMIGGAMDKFAHSAANVLVENDVDEPTIEATLAGPHLQFRQSALIALCGADFHPLLNDKKVEMGSPLHVNQGDILKLNNASNGARAYIAVKGGIISETFLGSCSTDMKMQRGGLNGRRFKRGDVIELKATHLKSSIHSGWKASASLFTYLEQKTIRVNEGLQYNWFSEESRHRFFEEKFTVLPQSDRMGIRLQGPNLSRLSKNELLTEGVTMGSIQVPPSGAPIVLMADRQTTGGYPKIAQVISRDLHALAQKKPGDTLSFEFISVKEAQRLIKEENKLMSQLSFAVTAKS